MSQARTQMPADELAEKLELETEMFAREIATKYGSELRQLDLHFGFSPFPGGGRCYVSIGGTTRMHQIPIHVSKEMTGVAAKERSK